jgi:hypothetical protein
VQPVSSSNQLDIRKYLSGEKFPPPEKMVLIHVSALTGTYHAIRKNYASRYLAEFEYRFNRLFDLSSMLEDYYL